MKSFHSSAKERGAAVFGIIAVLAVIYMITMLFSYRGWGYQGYNGYHRGPSFFYWGGPNMGYNPSARSGSIGGPSHRGGGISGGK